MAGKSKRESKRELKPKLRFPEFTEGPCWDSPAMSDLYGFCSTNSLSRDQLNYETGSIYNIHYGDIHTKFQTQFRLEDERVPFIDPAVAEELGDRFHLCREGDIVLADASEDLNDVGKAIELISLSGHRVVAGTHTIHATRLDENPVIGFGGYLFKSPGVRRGIHKEAQGAKVYGISANRIAAVRLPLPRTTHEQQKIADCLSTLDELIAAESRKLEALQAHKKGLMQQLFPREGETRSRLSRNSKWSLIDFPDALFFQEGPGIMKVDFHDAGVPLVRLSGLSGQSVTLDGCNFLDPSKVEEKWEHFRLVSGDLLVSCSASFGRPAVVTEVAAGAVFYTGLVRFRPKDDRVSVGYLEAFLGSPHFQRQAESFAVGGGIKHFGPSHLRQMTFPLPSPAEQQRIAECFSSIDDLLASQSRKLDALAAHQKGLMQQLFPSLEDAHA